VDKKEMRHYSIFSYSLSSLPQHKKVKFLRELFGYKETKNKKSYSHDGLLNELNGEKLGSNVILAPAEHIVKISNFFNSYTVSVTIKEVWIR